MSDTASQGNYSAPIFQRVNASTIKLNDQTLIGQNLTIKAYGPSAKVYSPAKLYNYVDNTQVLDDVILWDPARGIFHPEAIQVVDVKSKFDPAHYNVRLANAGSNTDDQTRLWGSDQVGKVWWNTKNLAYKPYHDEKIIPDVFQRLAIWGALADYSSIELYEWVKSDVAPADYIGGALNIADSSVPAVVNNVSRTRTWYARPVAWKYAVNPALTSATFMNSSPTSMYIPSTATPNATTAIFRDGRAVAYGIINGTKFSMAQYSGTPKTAGTETAVYGLAVATSDEIFTVGSSTSYTTPSLHASTYFNNLMVSVYDQATWSSNSKNSGIIKFNFLTDANSLTWITATCSNSTITSRVQITGDPFTAGTTVSFKFPGLGIAISGVAIYGTSDSWAGGLGVPTTAQLIVQLSSIFGNPLHNVAIYSSIKVSVIVPFTDPVSGANVNEFLGLNETALTSTPTSSMVGWVAWNDPTDLLSDGYAPYNQWQPMLGKWTNATLALPLLTKMIPADITSPFTLRDGTTLNQFNGIWSNWTDSDPIIMSARYYQSAFLNTASINDVNVINGVASPTAPVSIGLLSFWEANFTIPAELLTRATSAIVYVNGFKKASSTWNITSSPINGTTQYYVNVNGVNVGDDVVVIIPPYSPTSAELAYDPTVPGADPLILTQYAVDYPYVTEDVRSVTGDKTGTNYYFWVKGKCSLANSKKDLSINAAASLLEAHDGTYAITQAFKYYNQADGRPNRYGMLSVKNLGQYVHKESTYKIRVNTNKALRNTDNGMSLKNVHTEWALLRPKQNTSIPKQLWDLLIDSVCGENAIGQPVPSQLYQSYDDRNGTKTRYGFNSGQILVDSDIAKTTIKYTIRNTTINKYDSSYNATPDYISYRGFDITQLDSYLSTSASSREFLTDLWRNATPRQVNEIFFAVLEDALTVNYAVTDFFKTSMIAMQEVQIVSGS
jgi:hypothetical protein